MEQTFHRVLFVTPCAFNKVTGGGVTFSNLFSGWPKHKLATVTEDPVPVSRDICDQYFFLTSKELHYIKPFSSFLPKIGPGLQTKQDFKDGVEERRSSWVRRLGKKILGEAGIPDRGCLSHELKSWIRSFSPELLYTILGSPGYVDLVLQIQGEFKLPLVIHLMDEGVTDPRRQGLFGEYLRVLYRKKFDKVLEKTTLAMGICEAMAEEYSRRYGVHFVHFQNAVDLNKWDKTVKKDVQIQGKPRIVYVGAALEHAQLQSLLDCCHAVRKLGERGMPVSLDIFTPKQLSKGRASLFEMCPEIKVHDVPQNDEAFFFLLGNADLLLLPVNFDSKSVHFVRLSMPTKVPSYLASGTPILVYGPPGVAQVEYARKYGWGFVVDKRNQEELVRAFRRLLEDVPLRRQISLRARETAKMSHHREGVRVAFQKALSQAAATKSPLLSNLN